ncbi:MAG: T9SS type A sorting domain-containing protein, partial [Bacteroidota bacterium]
PDTLWIDTLGSAWPRFYYLTAVDSIGNESAHSDTVVLGPVVNVGEPRYGGPFAFRLEQNYPNPFNLTTTITYSLPSLGSNIAEGRAGVGSPVLLRVFDVLGREIATLVNGVKSPGRYDVVWDASQTASGVYFAVLRAGDKSKTIRMLLMK